MCFVYITHASFHSFHFLFSVDMLAHAIDNAAPSTIVLISGDRDFAYALSILRFRGYRIVLITLSNAHQSLRAQASISFDWVSEVLEPVDPTSSKQPILNPTRRGKISSPPAHDKFYPDSRFVQSPDPFGRAYINGGIQTPLDSTLAACSSDSETNFASRTMQTQTRLLRLLQTLQESPLEESCHRPSEKAPLIHESSPLSHQQNSPSLNNATRQLSESSADRIAIDDNPNANVSSPSLTPPSPTLSSAAESAITTENPMEHTTSFPVDPGRDHKFNFLVQYLKSHRRSRGSLSLLRSKLGLEVDEDETTYRMSGINRRRHISTIIVPDKFKILIRCLKSHRSRGNLYPLRRKISSEISQSGTTYLLAGVSTFGEYAMMAEKAGIVELGGSGSNAWIALKAPWYNVTNVRLS